jgi:hypothetical protein
MSTNFETFQNRLKETYDILFETNPDYQYAKKITTSEALANKMTTALAEGIGNKDGEGIKRVCKALGVKYTYKAIKEFLNA